MSVNGELASYLFHQGTNFYAYEYLGVHCEITEGNYTYTFRTWAPNADKVGVVGELSSWELPIEMSKITKGGIWECVYTSKSSLEGARYKLLIEKNGVKRLKGDPYARFSVGGAEGDSIIYTSSDFVWSDSKWLKFRDKTYVDKRGVYLPTPLNIYEMHLGSFIRHEDNSYYTYREIAELLLPYLKYMGYTHVELLPVAEHPYDGSWGYQVGAFYAPSSRFGTPDDFKYLVDTLHKGGIGVIVDWVPAHFPKDEWGLYEFDGEPLYEYQGKDRQESRSWGTRFFDLGREEVQSFLISNALYFLREFHVDGLRVDAVASMLYLDYDRAPGEWVPNVDGGRVSLEALAFFRKLNSAICEEFSSVLMIAEESDSYRGITTPVKDGGLGFNLKWNMGFANDFNDYVDTDPIYRRYKHKALNFPLMYAFDDNFVLPISHDEVVHGKKSYIDKMFGSYEDKFKQMRAALLLMMSYPGKKLTFMGTEFAQFREWDYSSSLEWFMLDYDNHRAMREYVAALNRFYLENRELWQLDFDRRGFSWIYPDAADENAVAYKRHALNRKAIIFAITFAGTPQTLKIPIEKGKRLKVVFATEDIDLSEYRVEISGGKRYAVITLPPYSGVAMKQCDDTMKIKI